MDFYERKKRACEMVDSLIKQGISLEKIAFKVETSHGFGRKFVEKRINTLREAGIL